MFKLKFFLIVLFFSVSIQNVAGQWQLLNSGTTELLRHTFFVNDSLGFFSNEDGDIYKTENYGNNWVHMADTIGLAINFISEDTGFCGLRGIYKTTDGGTTWNAVSLSAHRIFSIWFSSDDLTGFAAGSTMFGDTTVIYKSADGGNIWSLISEIPAVFNFVDDASIFFTSNDTGYVAGDGIRKTIDGGMSWTVIETGGGYTQIFFPAKDTGYVVGLGISKTVDGMNWLPINGPFSNIPIYSVAFVTADKGYIVGGNGFSTGAIISTIDGGSNWNIDYPSSSTFLSVSFPSANYGYVAGSSGSMVRWQNTNSINEVEKSSVHIYPNPSTGKFRIKNDDPADQIKSIIIYNSVGDKFYFLPESNEVDLSGFLSGIYFATILSDKKVLNYKLVLK